MAVIHWLLINSVPFLAVLTLVVTVHELGHFLVARWLGVAVDRFAIGFGRPLISHTDKKGIEWRVGWLPLGGYVRFAGDAEASSSVPDKEDLDRLRASIVAREGPGAERRYFHFKPVWARALVVAAGPVANFLLAIALFTVLLLSFGEYLNIPRVGGVRPDSPAARAGFQAGDLITRMDGRPVESFNALTQYVALRTDQPIVFTIDRAARTIELTATPVRGGAGNDPSNPERAKLGGLGLMSTADPADIRRVKYDLPHAVVGGVKKSYDIVETTVFYIGRMITGKESGDQLGGPLRIAAVSGQAAKAGAEGGADLPHKFLGSSVALLQLAAVLSVGIGFMNLLPVPVLDGGHLLFYAYESLARRPLGARIQAAGYRVGLALLLALMLFATWNDLQQLSVFKFLGRLFS